MHSPTTGKLVLGVFRGEGDLIAAAAATRSGKHEIHDAYTPYPVHGLDKAMGLRRSRFTWVCLCFAITGLICAVAGQFFITYIDWPVDVGGKPWNSLPAFLPIMFELTVLFGGVGTFVTLFLRTGMIPGREPWLPHEKVTDDRFVLAVAGDEQSRARLEGLWNRYHVEQVLVADHPDHRSPEQAKVRP